MDKKNKSLIEIIEDAPKSLTKSYLQELYAKLLQENLDHDYDIDALANSLLLLIIKDEASLQLRQLSLLILQKISPIKILPDILLPEPPKQLVYLLPLLIQQDFSHSGIKEIIKNLYKYLYTDECTINEQGPILSFLSKVWISSECPLTQDDLKRTLDLSLNWLMAPVQQSSPKSIGLIRSSSSLSINEIDNIGSQDFFTILNYTSLLNQQQLRSNYIFSSLRSLLLNSSINNGKSSQQRDSLVIGLLSEEDFSVIREYCFRIIDQVERRMHSTNVTEFHKICLVEVIKLLSLICSADSGTVHSIFPIVRRIYDEVQSNILKVFDAQDVVILTSSIQFFINHGSSVMHKPYNLYSHIFCELLSKYYQDNYTAFEIVNLMKENLSHFCYHSSILEKYFPIFFKVFAWRPLTFKNDFLELIPAFMSLQTSREIFYTLLDLPCLSAVLMLTDNKYNDSHLQTLKDSNLQTALKNPEIILMFSFLLRKTSGIGDTIENVSLLHQTLKSLVTHKRILICAHCTLPLLKCYFTTFLQYADMSLTVLLISDILERLSLLFPVNNYPENVQNIFSDALIQLFEKYPEAVFHCQKNIMNYISHLKNYFISEQNFLNLAWVVGEYVSPSCSNICKPEIITTYFETLECTAYEALAFLKPSADVNFLKLISISLTSLSKLAARNQDQIPRAVLCLSKFQQHSSFRNQHTKPWKIVNERILELLSILNSPNIAGVLFSSSKDFESGRLHKDPTSLPYILRTINSVLDTE